VYKRARNRPRRRLPSYQFPELEAVSLLIDQAKQRVRPIESRDLSSLEARQIDSLVLELLREIRVLLRSLDPSGGSAPNDLKTDPCSRCWRAANGMAPKRYCTAGERDRALDWAAGPLGSQIDTNSYLIPELASRLRS
jgi:hypothetical protein